MPCGSSHCTHASTQTLLHAPKTRLSTSGGFQTQAYCDDEKPKVPAECLMTGSSNEPASRPDASRNCADHPEAGQDPSAKGQVQRLCGAKTPRRVRRALGVLTTSAKAPPDMLTGQSKRACLCREVSNDHETHGRRSGGCRRAGVLISARTASVGDVLRPKQDT